ncbi:hypothetical protein [Albidovulum sp.]|jgi:hypothetical protein|uniref:hypothetical protein n=1 Tax=Albidovulum sp. TaxID=1872424 RepID=UPI0039B88ACC
MNRLTIAELTVRARRGIGKVDRSGLRGATLVSADEVEAMAMLLAILGVAPIYPGTYAPPNLIPHTEGERA